MQDYLRQATFPQKASIAIHKLNTIILRIISTGYAKFLLWRYGAKYGTGLRVWGNLRCISRGKLTIGENVKINSGSLKNFVGGDRTTNLWLGPGAVLEIGDNVGISNSTIIARKSIRIHHDTLIGGGCDIYDTDFHEIQAIDRLNKTKSIRASPIEIGPHAFIGGHTIILKGVTIGEGAVVGAGSLIAKDIPPYEVWGGRPALLIKKLEPTSLRQ